MRLKYFLALSALGTVTTMAVAAEQPVIGLITKTEINPFFVKMKEGAQQAAQAGPETPVGLFDHVHQGLA